MTYEAKQLYLKTVSMRYIKAGKTEKGAFFDQFCPSYGCSRNHAIRILNADKNGRISGRGRKPKYDPKIIPHRVRYWVIVAIWHSVSSYRYYGYPELG